ncbi:type II toxin-antitoxin system HicB family antitoxin [Methylobacter svalbardensis]|uniref:type II toxin-antitoxin system HicB family antitoxin n=1 Tax=Methylobacter svalbardensis TaxID=3080016 RepID=UPI0030EC708D
MEQIINLHIEKLPEGVYLATSDDISGLIAQGRTITETLEIASDVAKKLLEAKAERHLDAENAKLNPEQFFGVSYLESIDQLLESMRDEREH